jgi:hypothetical protein
VRVNWPVHLRTTRDSSFIIERPSSNEASCAFMTALQKILCGGFLASIAQHILRMAGSAVHCDQAAGGQYGCILTTVAQLLQYLLTNCVKPVKRLRPAQVTHHLVRADCLATQCSDSRSTKPLHWMNRGSYCDATTHPMCTGHDLSICNSRYPLQR